MFNMVEMLPNYPDLVTVVTTKPDRIENSVRVLFNDL
jgi:hypothetical protein